MKSQIKFADEKLKKAFNQLKFSKTENKQLHKWINKAMDDIEEDAFCSIQIPKKLIPKEYIKKYEIDNLWKYNMPRGWRLIYTVGKRDIIVISIILEWMDHKDYERMFNY